MSTMHPLEFMQVITSVASFMFGPQVGAVLGPYAVIIVCAATGAIAHAMRANTRSHPQTVGLILFGIGLAVVSTVTLSVLVATASGLNENWIFGPMAGALGLRNIDVLKDLIQFWAACRSTVLRILQKGVSTDERQ